jgi:hypothetical protein
VESFPENDRGLYKPDKIVEEDPLEAIVKKIKIQKQSKTKQKE